MHPTSPSRSINHNARVAAAFTSLLVTIPDYYRQLFASRAGLLADGSQNPEAAGSVYPDMTFDQLEQAIMNAHWRAFEHPMISPGCTAFAADIEGVMGLREIETLPPETPVRLVDPKRTGFVEARVQGVPGEQVDHTVLIVGQEAGREIVFTFHPGNPVPPSTIPARDTDGRIVDAETARAMGLTLAKIVK